MLPISCAADVQGENRQTPPKKSRATKEKIGLSMNPSRAPQDLRSCLFRKAFEGSFFVVVPVEDIQQLRDVEQIDDALVGGQKLKVAPGPPEGGKTPDHFTQTGAIHIGDSGQIQKDALISLFEKIIHCFFNFHIPIAQKHLTVSIDDDYISYLPGRELHGSSGTLP
jgi:hypothetical protein